MKTKLVFMLFAATSIMISSCGSKTKAPKGETEMVLPCAEFKSDRKTFRVYGFGESIDLNMANKKAMSDAKTKLAGMVSTTMKAVGDDYSKSMEVNNVEEVLERFENNARTIISQELSGVVTVCDRVMKTKEDKFRYYIAIELDGDKIVKNYYKSLSKNDKIMVDYNYEKFKETFEREMENQR
ncbi:MAG: hypothetical protein VXY91_03530 [Bacteroidota bacterium]|nr:hypothetical protein [Bacteroidota bacterium]